MHPPTAANLGPPPGEPPRSGPTASGRPEGGLPRCRPFRLMDTMILVAAAAIGMALIRPLWGLVQRFTVANGNVMAWEFVTKAVQIGATIAVLIFGAAYVQIRLRSPCLPVADLIRQPGMLGFILLIGLALPLAPLALVVRPDAPVLRMLALALGLSWAGACYRYRSRAEPGWIEGLGRTFGVGLIIALATS